MRKIYKIIMPYEEMESLVAKGKARWSNSKRCSVIAVSTDSLTADSPIKTRIEECAKMGPEAEVLGGLMS